jgi:hypothetical protein
MFEGTLLAVLFTVFIGVQFATGCRHNELSRVFTIKKRTYQVCFGCGKEFNYSWTLMRRTKSGVSAYLPSKKIALVPVLAPSAPTFRMAA